MEKTTYEELDKLIVDAVKASKSPLYDNATNEEASRIEKATGRDSDRVIDGRLQALRKKGVIRTHEHHLILDNYRLARVR